MLLYIGNPTLKNGEDLPESADLLPVHSIIFPLAVRAYRAA